MANPTVSVGLSLPAQPPLRDIKALMLLGRLMRLDGVMIWDHVQGFVPQQLWDTDLTWVARNSPTPHEWFDYQTLLGYLASRAGNLRLGVGVTEPIRRHPVLIAQAAMTLAHLTNRAPILGVGSGERENTEPYGFDFTRRVGRLEEALRIIRLCFTSRGPIDFEGDHFQLNGAVVDLSAPPGKTPEIWIGAHGPQMLDLTGRYGDGWYPVFTLSPDDYAAKLAVIHTAATAAGRDPNAITPSLTVPVIVAPTERETRGMLNSRGVRFFTLILPDHVWTQFGVRHPFGEGFGGFVDFVPERYSREEIEAGMAQAPHEMVEQMIVFGTPDQVVMKLRAFAEAGMRHVVPQMISALVSKHAALYSVRALWTISRALRDGE